MGRFTSRHRNKIDRKGRVSVPSAYRDVLKEQYDKDLVALRIYLKRNRRDGAIDVLTEDFMNEIQTRIDALDIGSDERNALEDEYFAESDEAKFDPEGRIILSKDLAEFAGIDQEALFVGLGSRFQIWQPEAYEEHRVRRSDLARTLTLKRAEPVGGGAS